MFAPQNNLAEVHRYTPTGVYCGDVELLDVHMETPDGELIRRHETRRISDTAYDIHVTDADGKLEVVLHHSNVGLGEPHIIQEEWVTNRDA